MKTNKEVKDRLVQVDELTVICKDCGEVVEYNGVLAPGCPCYIEVEQ